MDFTNKNIQPMDVTQDITHKSRKRKASTEEKYKNKTNDDINKCIICGVNIGDCNPRQYCRKTYCEKEYENSKK